MNRNGAKLGVSTDKTYHAMHATTVIRIHDKPKSNNWEWDTNILITDQTTTF